jgi:starvation-inducible DNA-binding protein
MNTIGLDQEKSKVLAEHLNDLLANYMVFYQNVRGFHWNIKGEKFFELHLKFEELYNNLLLKVDELAERILTLETTPLHSFEDYLQISSIKSTKDLSEGKAALRNIVGAFQTIIVKQRNILSIAGEAGDEGTNALMSDYIREQEKQVWMYRAYLG